MKNEERVTHPSYGLISFSRTNGTDDFFGSEYKPNSYITLEISEAEEIKDIVYTRCHPVKKRVKVRMTNAQFAELITTLNTGTGTPCTIEFIDGKVEQDRTKEYKVDFHRRKIKEVFKGTIEIVKHNKKQLESISFKLPKKDQEEIQAIMGGILQNLESNFPYFLECFYEQMEKVSTEIKTNLEADLVHKMVTLGIENYNQKLISDGK